MSSSDVAGVVEFFSNYGILSAELAVEAQKFVENYTADLSDVDTETLILEDEKNGKTIAVFHSRESSAFIDWCYLKGILNVPLVASFVNATNKGRANGIAKRIAERKALNKFTFIGRQYYATAAHNILNELMFRSTDWKIIPLQSMELINCDDERLKTTKTGIVTTYTWKVSRFLVNGKYVVLNDKTNKRIFNDFLKCKNSLVGISPNGRMTIPRIQKTGFDQNGKRFRETIGLDPTFSIMRISWTIVQNSFFLLELGPLSTKFEPLATEIQQVRETVGYRDNFDEFEFISNSKEFSKQEKHISESLFLTTENTNLAKRILNNENRVKISSVLLKLWFETFCGVSNSQPHYDHFRKMVSNFRKHINRVLPKERKRERTFRAIVPIQEEIPMDYGIQLKARPYLKSFEDIWHDMTKQANYFPAGIRSITSVGDENNQPKPVPQWILKRNGVLGRLQFEASLWFSGSGDGI